MIERYLPVFIVRVILAEILSTIGGFGSSVYFAPIANFFLDFQSVLGITALFNLLSNVSKIAIFKKGFDKKIVLTLGIPAVNFVSVGAWLSKFLDLTILNYLLGTFLVVLILIFLIFKQLVVSPNTKNSIIEGAASGLSAGIQVLAGPFGELR